MKRRRCIYCKREKAISAFRFYINKKGRKYARSYCQSCKLKKDKEYQRVHKKQCAGYTSEWKKRNPAKWQAHQILNRAVRTGKIKREKCHCGKTGHAHHADYSKPLEVVWLCNKHHKAIHSASL